MPRVRPQVSDQVRRPPAAFALVRVLQVQAITPASLFVFLTPSRASSKPPFRYPSKGIPNMLLDEDLVPEAE